MQGRRRRRCRRCRRRRCRLCRSRRCRRRRCRSKPSEAKLSFQKPEQNSDGYKKCISIDIFFQLHKNGELSFVFHQVVVSCL